MLQKAAFSALGIKRVLVACQSLRSLYYSAGGQDVGPDNFICEELVEVPSPHKTSLNILELDLYSGWDYPHGTPGCISDLSEFTALQALVVANEVVANWYEVDDETSTKCLCTILPTSLRFLKCQTYWDFCVEEHIQEMVAMQPEKFANLEKVTFTVDGPEDDVSHRRGAL